MENLSQVQREFMEKVFLLSFQNGQSVTYLGCFEYNGKCYVKYGSSNKIHTRTNQNKRYYPGFTLIFVQAHDETRKLDHEFGSHDLIIPHRRVIPILGQGHTKIIMIDSDFSIDDCIHVMRSLKSRDMENTDDDDDESKDLETMKKVQLKKLEVDANIKLKYLQREHEIKLKNLELDAEIKRKKLQTNA